MNYEIAIKEATTIQELFEIVKRISTDNLIKGIEKLTLINKASRRKLELL